MAGGIGILGAEGGAEGIYVAESHGIGLGIQLSAYGQVGGLAEKVLAEIHLSLLSFGILFKSMVVTWNISPAPSQSLPVIRGV